MAARVYVWVLREEWTGVGQVVAQAWEDHRVPVSGPRLAGWDDISASLSEAAGSLHLVVGGCGIGGASPRWLRERCVERVEGLPAVASYLWWREVGAVASRYSAEAGRVGDALVVAMPGQLDLARSLTHDVLLSEVGHWMDELGLTLDTPAVHADAAAEGTDEASGWWTRLAALGPAELTYKVPQLPPTFASNAPLMDVLHQAGQRGTVPLQDGTELSVWGFPDLLRPSSKVIGCRSTSSEPSHHQLVALHRRPQLAGTVGDGGLGLPQTTGEALLALLDECGPGCPVPDGSRLFALDRGEVWIATQGSVLRWDGRTLRDHGTEKQAFASLALRWSSR